MYAILDLTEEMFVAEDKNIVFKVGLYLTDYIFNLRLLLTYYKCDRIHDMWGNEDYSVFIPIFIEKYIKIITILFLTMTCNYCVFTYFVFSKYCTFYFLDIAIAHITILI